MINKFFSLFLLINVIQQSIQYISQKDTLILPTPRLIETGRCNTENNCFISIKNYEFKFYNATWLAQEQITLFDYEKNEYEILQINQESLTEHYKMIQEYLEYRLNKQQENGITLKIEIYLQQLDSSIQYRDPTLVDESYKIEINQKFCKFWCKGYISFLRALETFSQIITNQGEIHNLPIKIQDSPSYKYRGVMIDTSRHFIEINQIEKLIQGMQINKLNILHWHITDSESFPFNIKEIPDISKYGAYSPEEIYSHNQISKLQIQAAFRGVIIVPEFDTPSHTRSWALSPNLQELNSCFDYPPSLWQQFCEQPPCGQLDVTLNKTYDVVNTVLTNVQQLFNSEFIHIGGDEVNYNCWNYKPSIKDWMNLNNISNYSQLENYYYFRINNFIQPQKKKIFWFNNQQKMLNYPENSIIQYWGDSLSYIDIQNMTEQVILSTYDYLYLDCGSGDEQGDNSWCDPYKTWQRVYNFKPKQSNLGDRILGAELTLWSEVINADNLDSKIWPRTSAFAMRLWNEEIDLDLPELAQSLINMNEILYNSVEIKSSPVSDQFCEKNLDFCFFKYL